MRDLYRHCANCRHWHRTRFNSSDPLERLEEYCECKRFPPAVVRFVTAADGSGYHQAEHARTAGWNRCGEWQAADPQTVDEAAIVMARAVLAGDATAGRALADRLIELVVLPAPPPAEPND